MALNIHHLAEKGREFLGKAAQLMQLTHDENMAGRVVRAVLHTLRDQLSAEENLQLLAQLPVLIKGMYVEGWKMAPRQRIHNEIEFFEEVRKKLGSMAAHDLGNNDTARRRVSGVFETLSEYVSEGEMADVVAQLPKDLKKLFKLANTAEHL
jgi:uncharacterized protein (DUF2267 family)